MKTQLLTSKPIKLGVIFCIVLFTFFCCSTESTNEGDDTLISEEELTEINDFLASLSNFSQEEAKPDQEFIEEVSKEREGNTNECVVEKYKMAPGFDEMILLDPTSDVIYPGAMLKGESIPTGEYIGITGERTPITLSVSLENLNGKPSTVIKEPNIATVREGVKDMLQQGVTGSASAKVNFTTEEVYSEEHLNVALGASYSKGKNSISGSFNFNSSEKQYKYVIKYLQVYYTIDLTIEDTQNPGKLFTSVPNLNSTSPVIVSSVKYGRMLLYTVETNSKFTDTQAAFNAAFNDGTAGASGEHESFWNSSTVKALVIGGSSGDAAKVVSGPQGVYNYITEGGEYSVDSPGAPLGYTLRYIREGFPIANVVLSSEYNIRTCYEAYQKYGVELHGFNCVDNDGESGKLEIYGSMTGEIYQNKTRINDVFWSRLEENPLNVDENTFYNVNVDAMEVELYKPNLETDYVEIWAEFSEKDAFDDDDFGSVSKKIFLKDVQDSKTPYIRLNLQDDPGSDMRAYFYVWRIY
ncbi:thiol-activated cytolysin family protein [Seonamhaeicola sp. NFXS20]|uniref:thiol-activated cytolysin family protein n=1 Tax=unclassified Seonamhaeicola TaxID=2622645 RepID=UPI0035667836